MCRHCARQAYSKAASDFPVAETEPSELNQAPGLRTDDLGGHSTALASQQTHQAIIGAALQQAVHRLPTKTKCLPNRSQTKMVQLHQGHGSDVPSQSVICAELMARHSPPKDDAQVSLSDDGEAAAIDSNPNRLGFGS